MAGLYIHIPFCRQACIYCDFHFTISGHYQQDLCAALSKELIYRKAEWQSQSFQSVYFGGGTPSLLSAQQLEAILGAVYKHFKIEPDAEITLEANPDDLSKEKLSSLRQLGINRLSIGVQSFRDEDLVFMNRTHRRNNTLHCLEDAMQIGFNNFTIDLIYGIPGLSDKAWEENLQTAASLSINHLSCYSLTLEPATPYAGLVKKGRAAAPDEHQAAQQMQLLMDLAPALGFEQYEISNFARNNAYSIHNSASWKGTPYLGIGPSAHSFSGTSRRQNIARNQAYIRALDAGEDAPHLLEELSESTIYNELIYTGLRTIWGVNEENLAALGKQHLEHFRQKIKPWLAQQLVEQKQNTWVLNKAGFLLADRIAMECFY